MTSFNTLFNRMFQEKSKSVLSDLLDPSLCHLFFTIMMTVSAGGHSQEVVVGNARESINPIVEFLFMFAVMMFMTSFIAVFVYWIVSSVKN